jgi:hypothetical protein
MAVDFPKFFSTASQLYDLWPSFFNWLGGIAGSVIVAIVIATWWMRGYKAAAEIGELKAKAAAETGELKAEAVGLKGQIEILDQRRALASEQQKVAESEAETFKKQLAGSKRRWSRMLRQKRFRWRLQIWMFLSTDCSRQTMLPRRRSTRDGEMSASLTILRPFDHFWNVAKTKLDFAHF